MFLGASEFIKHFGVEPGNPSARSHEEAARGGGGGSCRGVDRGLRSSERTEAADPPEDIGNNDRIQRAEAHRTALSLLPVDM